MYKKVSTHEKKSLARNWTQNLQYADLMLYYWAIVADRKSVPKRIHKQLSHVDSFAYNVEKKALVVSTIF